MFRKLFSVLLFSAALLCTGAEIVFSGSFGQSQQKGTPIPWQGIASVIAYPDGLLLSTSWEICFLHRDGTIGRKQGVPGMDCVLADGKKVYFSTNSHTDRKIFELIRNGEKFTCRQVCSVRGTDRPFAVAPAGNRNGFAAKAKFFGLKKQYEIWGWEENGTCVGKLADLPKNTGNGYQAVGFLPKSGDLVATGHYPDCRALRLRPDGTFCGGVWPRPGYLCSRIMIAGGKTWALQSGIREIPEEDGKAPQSIGCAWDHYTNGVVAIPGKGFALATSQGLNLYDETGDFVRRIGGIGKVAAMAAKAERLTFGNGYCLFEMETDADSATRIIAQGNEPWHINYRWDGEIRAISPHKDGVLVLDGKEKQLWLFRSQVSRDLKKERWIAIGGKGKEPLSAASAEERVFVLEPEALLEWNGKDFVRVNSALPEGCTKLSAAVSEKGLLTATDGKQVTLLGKDLKKIWSREIPGGIADVSGFTVLCNDRIVLLNETDGSVLAEFPASRVPDSFQPGRIASAGKWIFVYDKANFRMLRFKINR